MLRFKYKNEKRKAYEMAYIIYMMAGSYYGSCRFMNPETEKRFYLYYQEMSPSAQINAESDADRNFRDAFTKELEQIQESDSRVTFREFGHYLMLEFTTAADRIQFLINEKGSYTFRRMTPDKQVLRDWNLKKVIMKDRRQVRA